MADPAEIEREVAQMAEYWGERREGWRDAAADEFERIVMPACLYGPEQDFRRLQMVNMCFTEWVLFERPLREGKTPLQLYVETPPEGTLESTVDHLRQIDETQFFARFAILDKDPETSRAMLLDVGTDRRYEVCDGALCKNARWRNGTIAERIACVDGLWQVVGQVHLYDRADPDATRVDGPGPCIRMTCARRTCATQVCFCAWCETSSVSMGDTPPHFPWYRWKGMRDKARKPVM